MRRPWLAEIGVSHLVMSGPTFEWGPTFGHLLELVPDLHAITPPPFG